ncbi:MAG: sulfatase/phosphatase domain-containing protein, partial [Sphingobacterium sp.]
VEDLFPTILQMAKVKAYQLVQQEPDGKDLTDLLTGKNDESWNSRPLIWNVPNKWTVPDGPGINFFSAVRQGDYKLLYDMKQGKLELYNLQDDIGELNNLAPKMKGKTSELSKLLSNQLRTWKAQLPTYKTTGQQIPYPDQLKPINQ